MLEIEWVDAGQSKRAKAQKWWRERDCKVSQIQVPVELLKLLPLEFCQILSEKSWFCNNNLIWRDAPNDGETEVERDSPEVSWLFALLEKRQSLCIVGSDCLSVFLFFFSFLVFLPSSGATPTAACQFFYSGIFLLFPKDSLVLQSKKIPEKAIGVLHIHKCSKCLPYI